MSKNPGMTFESALNLLDKLYDLAVDGKPPVFDSVETLANDYLDKYKNEYAIKAMIKAQVLKCTASGFVTGFGGLITLPASVAANIGSVMLIQMRMLACIAYMAGYDVRSDQCRSLVFAAFVGLKVSGFIKPTMIKLGVKAAQAGIKKIPGKVLTAINQKVGFRLITRFGSKGVINLGKMIPIAGAAVGGMFDNVETKIIAKRGYKAFVENDFTYGEKIINDDEIIDLEFEDEELHDE